MPVLFSSLIPASALYYYDTLVLKPVLKTKLLRTAQEYVALRTSLQLSLNVPGLTSTIDLEVPSGAFDRPGLIDDS